MKNIIIVTLILFANLFAAVSIIKAQNISDYLILQDIGDYKFITQTKDFVTGQPKTIPGYSKRSSPGILAGVDHFSLDHTDVTYETDYSNRSIKLSVEVQVTQHPGADPDRWLLHELDAEFRNYYGIPGDSYAVVKIDGNTIFEFGSGGWDYRWLSGDKVIMIEYNDLEMTKPEPMEVVRAYLSKHPSTLPPMTLVDLRSAEYKTMWIKDEMERRLWLCDKWFVRLESDRSKLPSILKTIGDHMVVFLNYREKYYGVSGENDKLALMGYLSAKNETGIRTKLTEYKNWWSANKIKPINLP